MEGATALFTKLLDAMPGEPIALEYLGVQAAKSGHFDRAVDLLSQGVDHPRCRPSLYLQLGHALRDRRSLKEAAKVYQRYLELEQDPSGAVSLADVLWKLDRLEDAQTVLRNAVTWHPNHTKAHCLLAMIYDLLGHREQAAGHRREALKTPATDHEALLMKSCASLDLGDVSGAFALIAPVANSLYGEPFHKVVHRYKEGNANVALPLIDGVIPVSSSKPLLLAVGDLLYVQKFAPDLIRAAARNAPSTDVHIHTIPNSPVDQPLLDIDALPPFGLTWEVDPSADATTFASRRFVRMAAWRRNLTQTIVAVDIDSRVNGDIHEALTELGRFDVAIRYRQEELFLTQRVAAGFLALAPTPPAQDFIDRVAAYILHFEEKGTSRWFVDQMALLAARLTMKEENGSHIDFADVPARYLDWDDFTDDSLIWTSKGAQKSFKPVE